ncbi:DUF4229 domain-containing protein [Vallicoccus soli]|uniref:DUF4229 domain-containing protein n=1 Tax=Vallicoccus soli TaxID=2339232 RepID=A0A3A3YWZ8_9ACTN|nr:DUF4229 domain-containing protein [Vallicoccus soli]RJK96097.1 DUF4229 domain-containing protein [Vallicoccus soli]
MRAVLVYTALRAALFAACLGVLYVVGARGVLLLVLAVLLSGALSLPLLSRRRDAVSEVVVRRGDRIRARLDEAAAGEDDEAR